jgi:hypothetical protein
VAGAAALLLAAAARRGKRLTSREIRAALIAAASPMPDTQWHPRYGFGRADVAAALAKLERLSRPGASRGKQPAKAKRAKLKKSAAKSPVRPSPPIAPARRPLSSPGLRAADRA